MPSPSHDAEHQKALDQFKLVAETEAEQRQRELEDLKFDGGDQWPEDVVASRQGLPATGGKPAVPARPMLTIRTLDQPTAQIINQARNARFSIKITPKSDASQDDADVRQGLIRAIEYDSHAQTAYLWAYMRAVICGRGYFRINKAWAYDDPDDTEANPALWDQELRIEPILNGATVYLDPWAQAVNDPAAAEWGFITEDIPASRYKRLFGESKLAHATDAELLTAMGDHKGTWVKASADGGEPSYRIAERFWTVYEQTEAKNPDHPEQARTVTTRKVMWAKLNGMEFLEGPQEWDGKFIPIIPVVGNEKNIGGKRYWEGIVRPNLGPCRMINYLVSSDAENMGLQTKAPWIGYEGQFEGHEAEWQQANTRNQPYLEVKAKTDDLNQVLPLPQRNVPTYPPSNEAIGMYVGFVRSTTGVPDAALGHVNPNDRSGKAITALQQAAEQGTSNYPDHLQRAIQHAGRVILDLLPHLYDRPGRVAQILTGESDEQERVILNAPFVTQQGQPVPLEDAPPPQPGEPMPDVKLYDLSKGQYSVVVDVGKSFNTRRQEAMASMGALAQAAPELVPRFADLWVKSMDIPDSAAIAERLKPPGVDDQSNIPPEVQAALAGMQQENQQLKQAIETKQVEQQAKLQTAQLDAETKLKIAEIGAQTQLVVAEIKAQSAEMDRRIAMLEAMIGFEKEARLESGRQAHEVATQAHEQAHDAGMAAMQHGHAIDQAETQAVLAPKPEQAGA